jgi:3-oxoacyl-[acyl-carrier protein] reductase
MSIPGLSLEGKVAIVTGAAGERGMGRAVALAFAEAGADVAVCDNVVDVYDRNLGAVAEEIKKLGRRSLAIQADISKKSDVDNMVQKVVDELGPVDILANCAAIIKFSTVLETDEESWDSVVDVDLKGCFLCSQAVSKGMMERKSGSIINVSSVNAHSAVAGRASYCAAKAGVTMFSRSLARELGSYNIRVNVIVPGAIETDMALHTRYETGDTERPAVLDNPERKQFGAQFGERVPLGRPAEASELASAVLFLASDAASYITGHALAVDGGMLA